MRNLLSLTQVLDMTYDVYRKYMKSFIGYTALMLMVSGSIMYGIMIVLGIVFAIIIGIVTGFMSSSGGESITIIVILGIGFTILMLPALSIMQLVAAGPIHAVEEIRNGKDTTFGAMFGYSFKKLWYVITSTLAYVVVYLGILGIGGLAYYLLYTGLLSELTIQVQIGVAIGTLLIVLLCTLWFWIKSALYLSVALCEKKHFFSAIAGSFRLVKGQFIRMMGILLSYWLSYFIIYISLGGLASLVSNLLTAYYSNSGSAGLVFGLLALQMILVVVQLGVSVAVSPIQYLTMPIVYFNERNRRYGDDLFKRMNTLIENKEAR